MFSFQAIYNGSRFESNHLRKGSYEIGDYSEKFISHLNGKLNIYLATDKKYENDNLYLTLLFSITLHSDSPKSKEPMIQNFGGGLGFGFNKNYAIEMRYLNLNYSSFNLLNLGDVTIGVAEKPLNKNPLDSLRINNLINIE